MNKHQFYEYDDFADQTLQDMQDHLRISHDLKRILSKSEPPLVRKFKEGLEFDRDQKRKSKLSRHQKPHH